jgi:GNAT superfamily N-acetyltransferase
MNHLRFRQATLADLPYLENVERDAAAIFPASALPRSLAPIAEEIFIQGISHGLLWVAETAFDAIVGFLLARREGSSLHVLEMDVLPEYGRLGVGARLLREACEFAAAQSLRFITLTTFEHFPWNAPFYAKRGFSSVMDPSAFPHLAAALRYESEQGLERRIAMIKHAA